MTDTKSQLTGAQKVAVVLMNMDQQRAAQVMKQFSDEEADEITAEILRLRRVDPGIAEKALNEFHDITTRGAVTRGGRDIAVGLLEASFGAERATGVLNRVASSLAGKQFEFLDAVEPGQVQMLLAGELPQTSALVLAHLRADHASRILAGLDDTARTEVAHAIATMGSPSPDAVRVVADTLKQRASAVVAARTSSDSVGGIQPLVDIINRADASTEKALLEALEQRDPALAEEVRSRMLTFEDIVRLEARDVQQVLRGVDAAVLAVAMKGAPDAVAEVITTNLSERNREVLEDEIRILGPVRLSQVEDARAAIVRAIRDLEATGAITVQRGDEDAYVE
ncbi:flagellar motor switch protein FliG [uncultured Leifsonia sp.]|uniref:flagellar motor switch protein FliG n=1 Tax=Leifsonia sp. TaxID=1870902 RepID=UPI0028D0C6F9|nr:flagellar motor switch protein FliG [uncultured Leifsonia sp.]